MSKLRESAKGQMCRIRIPQYCNHNPETTVLCHLGGAGMALKQPDLFAAFGCSACHDVVDGRVNTPFDRETIRLWHYDGIIETQRYWLKEGYIEI